MGDYHAVACLDLSSENSLAGIILRIEHLGRTGEFPKTLIHTCCLDNATILGDITKEHSQTAILGICMFQIANTTIGTIFVQLAPLCVLTTHLCGELTSGSCLIDTVSLWVNLCLGDIVFLHLLAEGLSIHTDSRTIDESALVEFVENTEDTTGTSTLLNTVFLCVRCQLAEAWHLATQCVNVAHLEVCSSLLCHCQ